MSNIKAHIKFIRNKTLPNCDLLHSRANNPNIINHHSNHLTKGRIDGLSR